MIENVSLSRSAKGATLPCDACVPIPCGLAVRKQHKMLFAVSKIESDNMKQTNRNLIRNFIWIRKKIFCYRLLDW